MVLVTKKGILKRTCLTEFSNKRSKNKGIIAISFKEGDALLDAILTDGHAQIMIAARNGRCVRFDENDARELGRSSMGVRGINIDDDDEVIGMVFYNPEDPESQGSTILVVSENGYGKRSEPDEYRITNRGAKGVRTLNITEKTGSLIAIKTVHEDNDLMIINHSGMTIRMAVSEIRVAGRATQGVKLINLRSTDTIAAVSVVAKEEVEEEQPEASDSQTEE